MRVRSFDVLGMAIMVAHRHRHDAAGDRTYERGYYVGKSGMFTFPDWPLKGMVVFGRHGDFAVLRRARPQGVAPGS